MRLSAMNFASIGLAALAVATSAVPAVAKTLPAKPAAATRNAAIWQDRKLDAQARATALLAAMTRAEKLQLVRTYFPPFTMGKPGMPTDMIPSAGYMPGIPRLGVPTLRESDASLGVANQVEQRKGDTATALPSSLATAASFDPAVAYEGGRMAGAEARAKTFNVLLAGGVNLTRDPWGGRDFEYLGEDPVLAGNLAGASIAGVQSNHIISTVKHFALNAQETGRMIADSHLDWTALHESDLLAFNIAIARGKPASVMCAYNLVNTEHACESHELLTKVLRGDWHYQGFVMSDWGAVHSTVKAAMSGLDQQSGEELDKEIYFGEPLKAALAKGEVPASQLDTMVRNVLTGIFASGLYDNPTPVTAQAIDYNAHADVAQKAAEEGIVLLKNAGILPLAASAKKIVLIGGHADVGVLSGGGSSQVRSVGGVPIEIPLKGGPAAGFARTTWHNSSPLQALRALLPSAQITYVDGSDKAAAAQAAQQADLALVFATQWRTEAEDILDLKLPNDQDGLIAQVAGAQPKTVVVVESGGPVLMPWLDKVGAVLAAWYPGQRGGEAIANILLGKVNPSGHLPITFPASEAQAPRPAPIGLEIVKADDAASNAGSAGGQAKSFVVDYREGADVGYRWYAKQGLKPLFPFGYGLSYTQFGFGGFAVSQSAKGPVVSLDVTNKGQVAGATVPQVYATLPGGGTARLVAYGRVQLAPGETRHLTLPVELHALAHWQAGTRNWRIEAGDYRLTLGTQAGDEQASQSLHLAQATLPAAVR